MRRCWTTALAAAAIFAALLAAVASAGASVAIPDSIAPSSSAVPVPLAAAGSRSCSATVSTAAAVSAAVSTAGSGAVVCLAGGTYAGLDLSGTHVGDVVVEPEPGSVVTVTAGLADSHGNRVAVHVEPNSSHIVLFGFDLSGAVEIGYGSSFVRVDHNDIHGGWEGVIFDSEDCTVAHAPHWSGCGPLAPVSDVTISGNRIRDIGTGTGDDALNVNNWRRLRITGNEITGIIENGNHTDCLQSVFGGTGMVFDHNYEHDNQCQGFFIKDGDATKVLVYDNLFVRDRVSNLNEANIQIVDTHGLVIRRNTNWSGNGDVLRADVGSYDAVVDHNAESTFNNGCCSEPTFTLTESNNIFSWAPWTFTPATSDVIATQPSFTDAAHDDLRITPNPSQIGVDWRPADQIYGPLAVKVAGPG